MQSSPGFDQRVRRSTLTVSSLTSSHERDRVDVRREDRRGLRDLGAERLDAAGAQGLGAALGDDERALPVVAAVDA